MSHNLLKSIQIVFQLYTVYLLIDRLSKTWWAILQQPIPTLTISAYGILVKEFSF